MNINGHGRSSAIAIGEEKLNLIRRSRYEIGIFLFPAFKMISTEMSLSTGFHAVVCVTLSSYRQNPG